MIDTSADARSLSPWWRHAAILVMNNTAQAIRSGKKAVRQQAENLTAAVDAGVQTYREAVETSP